MSGPIFMEFCKTERGGEMLIFDDHLHIKEKNYKDKTVWRCQEWYKLKCQGRVHLSDKLKVVKLHRHNHPPNTEKVVVAKTLTAIKEKALGTNLATKDVVAEVMAEMPKIISAKVPCLKSLKRMVQRVRSQTAYRHITDGNDNTCRTMEELMIEPEMPEVREATQNMIEPKTESFEQTLQSPTQELVDEVHDYDDVHSDMKIDEEDGFIATDDIVIPTNEDKESETLVNNVDISNNDKDTIEQRSKKEKRQMEHSPHVSRRHIAKKASDRFNTPERCNTGKTGNEFDIFGRSVAAQLGNMPLDVAVELQMSIQTLIGQARLNYLRESSSVQGNSASNHQDLGRTLTIPASVCSSPESDNEINDSEC